MLWMQTSSNASAASSQPFDERETLVQNGLTALSSPSWPATLLAFLIMRPLIVVSSARVKDLRNDDWS